MPFLFNITINNAQSWDITQIQSSRRTRQILLSTCSKNLEKEISLSTFLKYYFHILATSCVISNGNSYQIKRERFATERTLTSFWEWPNLFYRVKCSFRWCRKNVPSWLWGGEGFNWPRANLLRTLGQDGFLIWGIEYGRGILVLCKRMP